MTRAREIADRLKTLPAQTSLEVTPGLTLRKTSNGVNVPKLHYSAHPDRDPELHPGWKTAERKAYPSQAAWDREQEIVDEAGGGERVFADVMLTYWNKIVIEDPQEISDIVERCREWEVGGGFDHGKTNPTCLLRTYVDFDGTIIYAGEYYMPGREIWQHAPVMKRMYDFDRMEAGSLGIQSDRSIFPMTQQQEQRPGHAPERAKSYADLYHDQGVTNLVPFGGGDASDVGIICPRGLYADKPQPGLYHWGCPNLLWELMVARRTKLTAQQLLSRTTSEAIVDKDNHARDAMKYFLMMQPEPSRKPRGQRVSERIQATFEEAKRMGADPDQAMTSAVFQYSRIMHEEQEEDTPAITYYGGNVRHRIVEMQREIDRRYRGGWR
jgi:hypothetical protein